MISKLVLHGVQSCSARKEGTQLIAAVSGRGAGPSWEVLAGASPPAPAATNETPSALSHCQLSFFMHCIRCPVLP